MRPTWWFAAIAAILMSSLPLAQSPRPPIVAPVITAPAASAAVEQTKQGDRPAADVTASFDGLGVGFEGPHGMPTVRNPSDNALAVGPDHVVQIVNTRMAIFTKKGKRFDTTGRVLWGAAPTNLVFSAGSSRSGGPSVNSPRRFRNCNREGRPEAPRVSRNTPMPRPARVERSVNLGATPPAARTARSA